MNPITHLKYIHVHTSESPDSEPGRVVLWCSQCVDSEGVMQDPFYTTPKYLASLIELNNAAAQHIHGSVVNHELHNETVTNSNAGQDAT